MTVYRTISDSALDYPTVAYPATVAERRSWLVAGFVIGALAVLVFHQAALALLHAGGMVPKAGYSLAAVPPWGIPQVWSTTFWGGAWGVLLAAVVHRLAGPSLVLGASMFGMVFPSLAAWFIVAALKGQPLAAGFAPKAMAATLLVNAAWGLGTGLGLEVLRRTRKVG